MLLEPGQLVFGEKYCIQQLIGVGVFTQVYRATQVDLGGERALKVLHFGAPGIGKAQAEAYRRRFQAQAQLAAHLRHPNLIHVEDWREEGELLMLAMELATGPSLAGLIEKARRSGQRIPVAQVIAAATDVGAGLAAIHNRHLVHGHVKPSNVLLDQTGSVKLTDMGPVPVQGSPAGAAESYGEVPPGQLPAVDAEHATLPDHWTALADMHDFGLTLFEMLTGAGVSAGPRGTRVRSLRAGVPEWLDDLVARLLAASPDDRPRNGAEFLDLLSRARQAAAQTQVPVHAQVRGEPERLKQSEAEQAQLEMAERASQQAEAQAKLQEEQRQQEAEARARREAEEAQRATEELARQEADDLARLEAQTRQEEEERKRQEVERLKRQAEEVARRAAEERARLEALEKARREEQERQEALAREAKRQAEERARREAEKAKRAAEEQARKEAEDMARLEAQTKREAELLARQEAERIKREAEEKARREREEAERIKREAEEKARREREEAERVKREAEEKARREREEAERVKREAEEKARREREEEERRAREEEKRLKREADEKARREKEEQKKAQALQAKREAEERARLKAEEEARRKEERRKEAEAKRAKREAEKVAKWVAEERARREKEQRKQAALEKARLEAEERARAEEELRKQSEALRTRRDAERHAAAEELKRLDAQRAALSAAKFFAESEQARRDVKQRAGHKEHNRRDNPPGKRGAKEPESKTIALAPGLAIELFLVPEGEFIMGSDPSKDRVARPDEFPQRRVYLDRFWMARYPVTNEQFAAFVQAAGYQQTVPTDQTRPSHPRVHVNWDDALMFCRWVSQLTEQAVRLPTEAEWEKAARGADGNIYPWGNGAPTLELCNYGNLVGDTTPAGKYGSLGTSPYGCADMAGNVWEWCLDWYDPNYYSDAPDRNPRGPVQGASRVLRGGAFGDGINFLRCASRSGMNRTTRAEHIGFRVCLISAQPSA